MPPAASSRCAGPRWRASSATASSRSAIARARPSKRATCWRASTIAKQQAGLQRTAARARTSSSAKCRASTELIARGAATTQAHERAAMDLQTVQGLISVQTEKIADYTITAPMDGVVLRRDGEIGEIAEAGQILFRVGVPKPLQVVAEVNEEDIPRVAVGQTVLFRTDAFPDRRLEGKVREITPMGDVSRQDLSHQDCAAGRHAAQARHERGSQYRHARKAECAADAGRRGAGRRRLRHRRRRACTSARSRSASSGTRAVEILSGLTEGERVASPAATDLKDGARVRIVEASHEPDPRHRLDPCARPRAADRLRGRRRRDRRRLLDHDGGADAGLAGRFHASAWSIRCRISPSRTSAARRRRSRPKQTFAARRDPRPDAGGAPAAASRIRSPPWRRWRPGCRARSAPSVKVQAIIRYASHDVAVSITGIDPRREPQVSDLPKQMRGATLSALYRATNAIVLGDRLSEKIGARIGANITVQTSEGVRHQRAGGRLFSFRRAPDRRKHGLCADQDRADPVAADRADQRIAGPRSRPDGRA